MLEVLGFFLILPVAMWFAFSIMWLGRSSAYRGVSPASLAGFALLPGCLLLAIVCLLFAAASCAASNPPSSPY